MSPGLESGRMGLVGFPRVSGDEPPWVPGVVWETKFSPRERG